MRAANEGAGLEHSFGVNIRLPFEQKANPVLEGNPRLITYKYFFNRKVAFLKEADAVALFPGGFGTLDEAMETLTLVQTGKRNPLPLILVDDPTCPYWTEFVKFMEENLLMREYISKTDLALFERAETVEDAVAKINRFYSRYHSMRYVDGRLVIRLTSPLSRAHCEKLTYKFQDLLLPGGAIAPITALEPEIEDADIVHLPRIVIDFNRQDFGRLKTLIDAINEF
jgi:hypothetical protein